MNAVPLRSEIRLPETAARPLHVADLFCGAGNSSNAAAVAIARRGRRMELVAVNHWPVAVATHQANHPAAPHFCQDVETVKPREAVPGGRLDLLLASPECTHHSRARGGRPVSDQKRATAWCVPRWCGDLYVRAVLVENVEEFADWGPVDSRGRPIAARRGETFRAWVAALEGMGYRVEWRVLNAADHGDPTTRRRLFVQARRDGRRIRWPEPTHAADPGATLFGARARWRPAREVIDWSRKGRSVFARPTPLKPNTLRRLAAGVARYFGPLAPIYLPAIEAELARSIARWGDGAKGGIPKVRASGPRAEPFILVNRSNNTPKSADGPVPAILSGGHLGLVEPLLLPQAANSPARTADSPLPTLVTHGKPALVEAAFLLGQHAGNASRPVAEPVMALCAGGAVALVAPYYGSGSGQTCKPVDEPLDTVTTTARFGLAEPFLVQQFGERDGQAPRTHSVDAPLPAVTSHGAGAVATPFLVDVNHVGADARVRPVSDPMATITAQRGVGIALPVAEIDGRLVRCDLLFRMLEPPELAAAMSFPEGYRFTGNKTEITRQIGNAVPRRTVEALVDCLLDDR